MLESLARIMAYETEWETHSELITEYKTCIYQTTVTSARDVAEFQAAVNMLLEVDNNTWNVFRTNTYNAFRIHILQHLIHGAHTCEEMSIFPVSGYMLHFSRDRTLGLYILLPTVDDVVDLHAKQNIVTSNKPTSETENNAMIEFAGSESRAYERPCWRAPKRWKHEKETQEGKPKRKHRKKDNETRGHESRGCESIDQGDSILGNDVLSQGALCSDRDYNTCREETVFSVAN